MGICPCGRGWESFSALAEGLQNALWLIGGAPREHRTDSLSAAFKNFCDEEDFTRGYRELGAHYGMTASRTNRGVSHSETAAWLYLGTFGRLVGWSDKLVKIPRSFLGDRDEAEIAPNFGFADCYIFVG